MFLNLDKKNKLPLSEQTSAPRGKTYRWTDCSTLKKIHISDTNIAETICKMTVFYPHVTTKKEVIISFLKKWSLQEKGLIHKSSVGLTTEIEQIKQTNSLSLAQVFLAPTPSPPQTTSNTVHSGPHKGVLCILSLSLHPIHWCLIKSQEESESYQQRKYCLITGQGRDNGRVKKFQRNKTEK